MPYADNGRVARVVAADCHGNRSRADPFGVTNRLLSCRESAVTVTRNSHRFPPNGSQAAPPNQDRCQVPAHSFRGVPPQLHHPFFPFRCRPPRTVMRPPTALGQGCQTLLLVTPLPAVVAHPWFSTASRCTLPLSLRSRGSVRDVSGHFGKDVMGLDTRPARTGHPAARLAKNCSVPPLFSTSQPEACSPTGDARFRLQRWGARWSAGPS